MMKSAFVDDGNGNLSPSCNLGQEIMFFMLLRLSFRRSAVR